MKKFNLFGEEIISNERSPNDQKYTMKIDAPIYEPKNEQPDIFDLYQDDKTKALIYDINQSNVTPSEKKFLLKAAQRHTVFHYEKIADYYAHATPEMQSLMEKSALVIIDFNEAIELGYVKLCEDIKKQYLEDYED
jgi:hypothetical protein